jgi:hypothetical protein
MIDSAAGKGTTVTVIIPQGGEENKYKDKDENDNIF